MKKFLTFILLFVYLPLVLFLSLKLISVRRQVSPEISASQTSSEPIFPVPVGNEESRPVFSANAVLAVDVDSQVYLFEKNSQSLILPASTTKIMTALVALDYFSPEDILTFSGKKVEGQKMGLVAGERIKLKDLLTGLLIYSANDAATAIAENYPGGERAFVSAMNLKARKLKMFSSSFKNPSGLDEAGHFSTAEDLAKASIFAMRNPLIKEIVSQDKAVVKDLEGKLTHKLVNLNELVGKVEGVLGVKTGWTPNSRENLITYIERDGKKILIVILGSDDRFAETRKLIDWVFGNFEWR